jgi:hypothetical protein
MDVARRGAELRAAADVADLDVAGAGRDDRVAGDVVEPDVAAPGLDRGIPGDRVDLDVTGAGIDGDRAERPTGANVGRASAGPQVGAVRRRDADSEIPRLE